MVSDQLNRRILVIDDEEAIRASFGEILLPRRKERGRLEELSRELFGEKAGPPKNRALFDFHVDLVPSGEEGVKRVITANETDAPYAAIFVDVRMPGMDGLETVQEIRKHDSRAEIIFITAYSDYEIEEIVSKAGANVGYHTKPFAPEEIRQLATKAVYEWNKNLSLENLISVVSELRTTERELDLLLSNILQQVAELLGSQSALIAARKDEGFEHLIGMGLLADKGQASQLLERLPAIRESDIFHDEEAIYYGMSRFGIVALFEGDSGVLTNHRIYMAKLFLEEAAQAIRNAELREELMRKEKLSAVGQGVSMVAHDLRSPLGNIISLVSLLEDDTELSAENEELLDLIRSSADSATSIVNDILDFARGGRLHTIESSTTEVCNLVEREAHRMVEENDVILEVEDTAEKALRCDVTKLSRAFVNLIRNAAEAFRAATIKEDPRVTLRAEDRGDAVLFTVSDNGPGLPPHVRENLFVPFLQSDGEQRAKHTGLGLAIVKQFVELHGGTVDVVTGEEGTTFSVELPTG